MPSCYMPSTAENNFGSRSNLLHNINIFFPFLPPVMSRHVFVSLTNLLKSQIIHLILNYSLAWCRAPLLQGFVVTGGRAARLQLWFLSAPMTKISCSASLNMKLTCSTYPLTQGESATVAPCDTLLICHDARGRGRLCTKIGNRSSTNFLFLGGGGWGGRIYIFCCWKLQPGDKSCQRAIVFQ